MALNTPRQFAWKASALPLLRTLFGMNRHSRLLDLMPRAITHEGVIVGQHIREGRFQRSLALIAGLSSLPSGWEVSTEHYRGSYNQRIMYSPVLITPLMFVTGVWGAISRKAARRVLPVVSVITLVDGMLGFIWHVRGIARKPGGWRIPVFNLVMGPPVLAPILFAVSGYLGLLASLLRREDEPGHSLLPGIQPLSGIWRLLLPHKLARRGITLEQEIREGRFQRHLAATTTIAALCSGFEALYSHYKNNFTYKVQWTPILLTPVLMFASLGTIWSRRIGRTLLPIASILAILNGMIGSFYHARGLFRRAGGVKFMLVNPPAGVLYRLTYSPPPFAPLLFAASGFIGLLASLMRREH